MSPGVPVDALRPADDLRGPGVTDALATRPERALPDAATPDAAAPDLGTPADAAAPDLGTPADAALPDAATPDLGTPADARPPLPPDANHCAPEACNGLDDDCDGATDEGLSQACGLERGECHAGQTHCVNGVYGQCEGATGPTVEICDALDNDCDGSADGAGICKELCGSPGQPCCMGLFCVRVTLCVSLQCR